MQWYCIYLLHTLSSGHLLLLPSYHFHLNILRLRTVAGSFHRHPGSNKHPCFRFQLLFPMYRKPIHLQHFRLLHSGYASYAIHHLKYLRNLPVLFRYLSLQDHQDHRFCRLNRHSCKVRLSLHLVQDFLPLYPVWIIQGLPLLLSDWKVLLQSVLLLLFLILLLLLLYLTLS